MRNLLDVGHEFCDVFDIGAPAIPAPAPVLFDDTGNGVGFAFAFVACPSGRLSFICTIGRRQGDGEGEHDDNETRDEA